MPTNIKEKHCGKTKKVQNSILQELKSANSLNNYAQWVKANEKVVNGMETKKPKKWKEYISEDTKWLIEQRDIATWYTDEESAKEINRRIRKQIKEDKKAWIDEITKKTDDCKEMWQGIEIIGKPFKAKRYARHNRKGDWTDMEDRAEATKEYLAKDHWGKNKHRKSDTPTVS